MQFDINDIFQEEMLMYFFPPFKLLLDKDKSPSGKQKTLTSMEPERYNSSSLFL